MRHTVFAALLSVITYIGSAHAAQPIECELSRYSPQDCIDAQKSMIDRLERKFSSTVDFIRDQTALVRGSRLDVMRADGGLGPKFTRMYEDLAQRMGVDRNSDEERFPLIRSVLSDPQRLTAFYIVAKPLVRESIRRFAVVGIVNDAMAANTHLFHAPFATPVSAGAQEWYENYCFESNESPYDSEFKEKCSKLEWFPKRFKETYGVDPTADAAKILSFLHRRYREGGMPIVLVWQHMGQDLLRD